MSWEGCLPVYTAGSSKRLAVVLVSDNAMHKSNSSDTGRCLPGFVTNCAVREHSRTECLGWQPTSTVVEGCMQWLRSTSTSVAGSTVDGTQKCQSDPFAETMIPTCFIAMILMLYGITERIGPTGLRTCSGLPFTWSPLAFLHSEHIFNHPKTSYTFWSAATEVCL